MANVPTHFSATIQDGLGVKASTVVYLNPPDTTTLAALAADIGTWLADLDGITQGVITANQIRVVPNLPGGLKAATGATYTRSYAAKTLQLAFSASGTTKAWGQAIPAIAENVIVNGKPDLHGASIGTYTSLLLTSPAGYVNANNQLLTAVEDAGIGDRSKRKQQQSKTRTV